MSFWWNYYVCYPKKQLLFCSLSCECARQSSTCSLRGSPSRLVFKNWHPFSSLLFMWVGKEGVLFVAPLLPSFLFLPVFSVFSLYMGNSQFFLVTASCERSKVRWGEKGSFSFFFLRLPNKGKGFLCHDLREERIKERGALVCYEFRFCPERCWRIFHLLKTNIYVSKKYFCSK